MAIIYDETKRIFTLHTAHSTYQMKVDDYGYVLHLYYGAKTSGDMDYLLTYYDRGFSGNPAEVGADRTYSLDALPQEYPFWGTGDYRNSALILRDADGSENSDLRYVGYEIKDGKYALTGLPAVHADKGEAQTLILHLEDVKNHVHVQLLYGVIAELDMITRSAAITNQSAETVILEKAMSANLDFVSGDYDLISFYGRHAMERNMQRTAIAHGSQVIGSRRGTSSHQYNPAVILAGRGTTEDAGACYGMMFVYSGSFTCEVERDQYGQTRALIGLQSEQFHYPVGRGETFIVPETVLCYSGSGLANLSNNYHRCVREHICRGIHADRVRPVLINSWEAAYFDFTGETILRLAEDAAELGIDMVVMDDGWFGHRQDDNSSLGDWQVNEEKLGCTLGELVRKVNARGVKFGIWIEPEMVSEDSELYREHPDWALAVPGRKPVHSRNQLVLDFSRVDVREHVFAQICKVLDCGNIEYVKWDMNRSLSEFYSAGTTAGKVAYDYVLGVYDFLEKLLQRYPGLLIEGCSGGGGRFDAGMMYYTPQIWCSDNTDAIDRVQIQYGTSFFYPASVVGAHVSAVPNHQTGRSTSLATRGVVAMAGTFGYELDPAKLSEEEKAQIREQIAQYKRYARLIQTGDYYRLSNPASDGCAAWMFVDAAKTHVLFSAVMLEIHGNMTVCYIRFKGLDPDACYEDTATGARYYGAALMAAGLPMPVEMREYAAYQIELVRCGD